MNTAVENNQSRQLAPYQSAIGRAKKKFVEIASDPKAYDRESIYAMQHIIKNDFSQRVANENPMSVHLSMVNVASVGLTLSPANGYAYLVPRDGAIVLDISYKGLIKIATDTGSVEWVRADLVYESDEFIYNGPAEMPTHKANPFKGRGDVVGVYCIAKTHKGDILTEVMGMDELEKIRGKSMSYIKRKSGPWVEWFDQMAKKAVIKRASKTWPYTDRMDRLNDAIDLANETEGGYDLEATVVRLVDEKQSATIRDSLEAADVDPKLILDLLDVDSIDAIPAARYTEVLETIKEAAHADS